MSTRIFKGNLSEGGRFARRGLFKMHFSVGGGKLISTQLYVSHASQVLRLPWKLRVFDTKKKRIPGFSLAHFPKHCWLKGCLLGSRELFKSNLSLTLKSLFLKLNYLNCNRYPTLKALRITCIRVSWIWMHSLKKLWKLSFSKVNWSRWLARQNVSPE